MLRICRVAQGHAAGLQAALNVAAPSCAVHDSEHWIIGVYVAQASVALLCSDQLKSAMRTLQRVPRALQTSFEATATSQNLRIFRNIGTVAVVSVPFYGTSHSTPMFLMSRTLPIYRILLYRYMRSGKKTYGLYRCTCTWQTWWCRNLAFRANSISGINQN